MRLAMPQPSRLIYLSGIGMPLRWLRVPARYHLLTQFVGMPVVSISQAACAAFSRSILTLASEYQAV